jgi:hypothetical protein
MRNAPTVYMEHIPTNEILYGNEEYGSCVTMRATKINMPISSPLIYPHTSEIKETLFPKRTTRKDKSIESGTNGRTAILERSAYTDTVPNVNMEYGSVIKYADIVVVINSSKERRLSFGQYFLYKTERYGTR